MASRPNIYLTTSRLGARPVSRTIPTEHGSWARVAVNFPDAARSLELWTDPLGRWSLDTVPSPAHGGSRVPVLRGDVRTDVEPVTLPAPDVEPNDTSRVYLVSVDVTTGEATAHEVDAIDVLEAEGLAVKSNPAGVGIECYGPGRHADAAADALRAILPDQDDEA